MVRYSVKLCTVKEDVGFGCLGWFVDVGGFTRGSSGLDW